MDVGFELVTGFIGHFKHLITIHYALSPFQLVYSTIARTESSRSDISTLVLRQRLPTTNVPLPLSS
jgi:hypothetical protein